MNRIAIIPARGGSQRLPYKNLADFRGRPIIAHTVEAARGCGLFERVVVSTEDAEIAEIAKAFGAEVVPRPAALASDQVQVKDVCLHTLDSEGAAGRDYDVFCCLYATSPLRNAADIAATVALVEPGVCDFAMAVTDCPYPPFQALKVGTDNRLSPMWPDLVNKRSQEIGRLVVDNGSTYCATVEAFRRYGSFYGPGLRGHPMPFERSIDIDVQADIELALLFADRLNL